MKRWRDARGSSTMQSLRQSEVPMAAHSAASLILAPLLPRAAMFGSSTTRKQSAEKGLASQISFL
jgi:hypothetical protein